MTLATPRGGLARLFAGAVVNQALLSLTSFVAGLLMIRRTNDTEYGYYVLITAAVPLLSQLQAAFIFPAMANRVTRVDLAARRDFVGGVIREQQQLLSAALAIGLALLGVIRLSGLVGNGPALIIAAGIFATAANLFREFFRGALQAYRRPYEVLRGDLVYCVVLVAGVFVATLTAMPAAVAASVLAVAGACGGVLLAASLWRYEPWSRDGAPGVLRGIGVLGAWAAAGSAIHWTFTQGYSYIVAGTLDVASVAGIAATRLMLMPVVLFSIGITTLMMPTASLWLQKHGTRGLLRRLGLLAVGMGLATICYSGVIWFFRGWIFDHVLKRHFAGQDLLLLLWSATFLSIVVRDQLIFLLIAHSRFKILAALTLFSAVVGLTVSYVAMHYWGAAGAPLGVLVGELIHIVGVLVLALREVRRERAASSMEMAVIVDGAHP